MRERGGGREREGDLCDLHVQLRCIRYWLKVELTSLDQFQ